VLNKTPDANGERLLKPIELARWLNFGVDYIRKLVEEDGIPYIELPGGRRNIRFSPRKIRAWLEERSVVRRAGRKIGDTSETGVEAGPRPPMETDIVGHFRARKAGRDQA
jgi:excisionase family DNA binding protein